MELLKKLGFENKQFSPAVVSISAVDPDYYNIFNLTDPETPAFLRKAFK